MWWTILAFCVLVSTTHDHRLELITNTRTVLCGKCYDNHLRLRRPKGEVQLRHVRETE